MNKLRTLKEIRRIAGQLKKKKKKIVFTNGCFDVLHLGHIKYLEKCKRLGDVLIVGLNSDGSVRKIKGKKRPITGQGERAVIISALESVDYVTIFGEATPAELIRKLTPHILAKGGDWRRGDIVGSAYVKKTGGRVVTIPFVKGYSTTNIIRKIRKLS